MIVFLRKEQVIVRKYYDCIVLAEYNGESMRGQCYGIYIRAMTNKADGIPSQLSDSRN